jgi:ubiquinone/menaquinone biosynthesis C-methylase UbiE
MMNNDEFTLQYYGEQAKACGASGNSTMKDNLIRENEIKFIMTCLTGIINTTENKILDIGCGNGYTTEIVSNSFPKSSFIGLDFCDDLLNIAKSRSIPNCQFQKGDVRKLDFEDNSFDIIYTERCLINIRDWEEQKKALNEIKRVLKPHGVFIMIECFLDGYNAYNQARTEMDLSEIKLPDVNLFFDKEKVMEEMQKSFILIKIKGAPWNFLSSHYFITRVFHPSIVDKFTFNSEFVKFFSEALQPVGNYSPIQGFVFKKSSH